jgi:uracil-DNA glycosylase
MSAAQLPNLQDEIRQCRRCVERGFIPEARPVLFGTERAKIMVIGQAPGPTAAERPLPFSGASGKTLQGWLSQAGFEAGALHDPERFYLTSLTKCFPGRSPSGKGDRAPGRAEIELCSSHLDAELCVVRPELVLALGRIAIGTMVASSRGQPLAMIVGGACAAEYPAAAGAQVLPLPHPSGVSRWHNAPANRRRLSAALSWLAREKRRRDW